MTLLVKDISHGSLQSKLVKFSRAFNTPQYEKRADDELDSVCKESNSMKRSFLFSASSAAAVVSLKHVHKMAKPKMLLVLSSNYVVVGSM